MKRITREESKRENTMRDSYDMEYISPLEVPRGVKKEGYTYRFVNTGIKGEANFRVEEMAAKGWSLVPADRAPNYSSDPLGRNPTAQKYICYKDVILMERPDIYSQKEKEAFNKFNEHRIKSLRGVSNDVRTSSSIGEVQNFC